MNHVPPSVRAALQRRNRQDILDQEGEYAQFKDDIEKIIHGDDQGTQRNEDVMIPDFEEDISPEEKKVDKAVEGYAAKHGNSTSHESPKYDYDLAKRAKEAGFDVASEEETKEIFGKNQGNSGEPDARPNHNKLLDMELDDDKVKLMARKYIGEDKLSELARKNDLESIDDLSTEDMLKYMSDDDIADMMVANGYDEIDLDDEEPLHIKSFKDQVARNPGYKKIADSLSKEEDVNDAYFYAFKDAYERNGYEPSENNISDELSDKYWELADNYRDSYGMSDGEWDRYGQSRFEEKYGTEDEFINKGLEAHNKYFDELGGPESSDVSDDEISEALADYQWQITDKTTVDDYARETAEKLGVDKDRVLKMIKSESPDIKDTDKMAKVAGLEDEEGNSNEFDSIESNLKDKLGDYGKSIKVSDYDPESGSLRFTMSGNIPPDVVKKELKKIGLEKHSMILDGGNWAINLNLNNNEDFKTEPSERDQDSILDEYGLVKSEDFSPYNKNGWRMKRNNSGSLEYEPYDESFGEVGGISYVDNAKRSPEDFYKGLLERFGEKEFNKTRDDEFYNKYYYKRGEHNGYVLYQNRQNGKFFVVTPHGHEVGSDERKMNKSIWDNWKATGKYDKNFRRR